MYKIKLNYFFPGYYDSWYNKHCSERVYSEDDITCVAACTLQETRSSTNLVKFIWEIKIFGFL